ncbi:MAG: hypothetical protein EA425_02860, partial [Puniceicoccaceae bacterium]
MKASFTRIAFALIWACFLCLFATAENVTVWIERSPTPHGPWDRVDLATVAKDPFGNPRFPVEDRHFFRTRIEFTPETGPGAPIALANVPEELVDRAWEVIAGHYDNGDPEGWHGDIDLADAVFLHESVLGEGNVLPSHFEFKIVRRPPASPTRPGFHPTDPEFPDNTDAGYILLSLTEEDFPVTEYATSGPTNYEILSRRAGTTNFRLMRYGPTFWVAEDEKGEMIASLGAMPYRPDPQLLLLDGLEWRGDSETGLDLEPTNPPRLESPAGYDSYTAFKKDFIENPVFRKMRANHAERARPAWDAERGVFPSVIVLEVGESRLLLQGLHHKDRAYEFVSEDGGSVHVTFPLASGGVNVSSGRIGSGILRVRIGSTEERFEIHIGARTVPTPAPVSYPRITSTFHYAGNWPMQPKYHQFTRPQWCSRPGCGPVAWAILFAWFDLHRGVDHAFRGEGLGKNPPPDTSTTANQNQVVAAYNELHDYCNVICNPFSSEGGTWPPSMTNGFKTYTVFQALGGLIGRQWHTNAITGTWPDAGALRSRDAIINGYPAVTGLGWLWHYVVAYGYQYRVTEVGPIGPTVSQRFIKCNMGWSGVGPRWYNLGDSFY